MNELAEGDVVEPCGNGGTCLANVARKGPGCQQSAKPYSHRCIYHQDVPCEHVVSGVTAESTHHGGGFYTHEMKAWP